MSRIVLFSCFYPPHLGGVERYSWHLAQKLRSQGHDVLVITTHDSNKTLKVTTDGENALYLPSMYLIDGRLALPRINSYRIMKQAVKKFNPDEVIINTHLYIHTIMAAKITNKLNIPSLFICHGTGHVGYDSIIVQSLYYLYEHTLASVIRRNCSGFGGVSQACCIWLDHFGIDAKYVVYNAFELENELDNTLDILDSVDDDVIVYSFAARMIEEKGIIELLNAFVLADEEIDDKLMLIVAGAGPLLNDLNKKYSCDNIVFTGLMSHDKVLQLYKGSDVYVSPSKYPEGLPTSILEAASLDCAIIATPMGGTTEMICDKKYGLIVPHNDVQALKTGIITLAKDTKMRNEMAVNIKQRARDEFNWTKSAIAATDALADIKDGNA